MNLFSDERVLLESDNGAFTLTNYRARHTYKSGGLLRLTSLMLSEIITISSPSAAINLPLQDMQEQDVLAFVEHLEAARRQAG